MLEAFKCEKLREMEYLDIEELIHDSSLYNNDDSMDENDNDDRGSDVYSQESDEDDSQYETRPVNALDTTQDRCIKILERAPIVLDSFELNGLEEEAAGPLHDSAAGRSKETETQDVLYVDRAQSPKPGCSKDSQPVFAPSMPCTSTNEATMRHKTSHILRLVSRIHRNSVFDALRKDDKVPIKEIKLWDLIPERWRREYSQVNARQDNSKAISAAGCEKASDPDDNTRMQMEWTVTNNGAKRGTAVDICTARPKQSSLDPDLSINASAVQSNSLPGASCTSEIAHLPAKPVNRGAIPKVRNVPLKKAPETLFQAVNDFFSETEPVAPMKELPGLGPVDEALVGKSAAEREVKSAASSSVARAPFLKYRKAKSAGKNSKLSAVGAARSVTPKSGSASAPVSAGNIKQQRAKEMKKRSMKASPQRLPVPASVALETEAASTPVMQKQMEGGLVNAAPINQRGPMDMGHPQELPIAVEAPVAAQPLYLPSYQAQFQEREQALQLTESAPATAATTHQQRQTGTVNRLPQTAPVTATTTHQYYQMETVNRPKQSATTTAPVAAAPINQQRQTEMVNRAQQPAPMNAPVAAAPLKYTPIGIIDKYTPIGMVGPQWPSAPVAPLAPPVAAQPLYLPRQPEFREREQALQLPEAPIQRPAPANEQSTKPVICKEMYYKLRNIFPNVDSEYIEKLCPPDWGPGNKDDQMAPIIEHLLEAGETLPQHTIEEIIERADNNVLYKSFDDLYEFLIGIFPDADPHFLRDFAVRNVGRDEAIKNFVDTNLEGRKYPTRKQYMARLEITKQRRQYTTGFEVKQFLSIIPDPSKHFMDPQRKCTYQAVALEFLKTHFTKHLVATISAAYTRNRYNLSLAAQELESLPEELKSKRGGYETPIEDISLLQEIAFVKHKADINNYIAQVKRREDEEFKTLKAMNQLLECQCCYDSECVPSKCSECDNGHIFCNSCVVTGTSARMGEDQTRIYCFINCGSEFSLSVLQQVLAPTTFSILLKKRQAAEITEAGLDGLVSCPFCHFASIPPEGDKIFKCLNSECTKESCRLCKELSHVPLKCGELTKTEDARRYIEEKMTQALARKCYKCQRAFVKADGCNKITCPCGAMMCYLCDKPITGYSHFRGQAGADSSTCELHGDTLRFDAVVVRKVAEEAQREMLKRNPNINIDTTSLLRYIPNLRNGLHNDVLNADPLPERAQRVIDLPLQLHR